jgi:type IV pilus assembly protein PilC
MLNYRWKGLDSIGRGRCGWLAADSPEHLRENLLSQKIALLEYHKENRIYTWIKNALSRQISPKQLYEFFDHLSILVASGIPLVETLRLCSRQVSNKKLQNIIIQLKHDVSSGNSFSAAIKKCDKVFDPFIFHLIKAGEESGKIDVVLSRISERIKSRIQLQEKFRQASLLPALTLLFALTIILGIFIFIIPQFAELFSSMNKPIPSLTSTIISASILLRTNECFVILASLPMVFLIIKHLPIFKKLKPIKDKLLFKTIFIGNIIQLSEITNFLETVSMILKSGIPVSNAVKIACNSLSTNIYQEKVARVSTAIAQGKSFEQALIEGSRKYFPDNLVSMVSVGEQSGNLTKMLDKSVIFFQASLQTKIQFLTTILQPILLIIVGLLIGGLMLSVYLPIFGLADIL